MEENITGISIVTKKDNGLVANIDFESGEAILSDDYDVVEHTKEKPAIFRETGLTDD